VRNNDNDYCHISNLERRIGATSLGEFEVIDRTRRVSSQGTVDLQDDIPTPPLLMADRSSSLFSITELPAPRLMPVLLFEKSSFPPITPTRPCLFPLIDLLMVSRL
jgi:hypothetical protein